MLAWLSQPGLQQGGELWFEKWGCQRTQLFPQRPCCSENPSSYMLFHGDLQALYSTCEKQGLSDCVMPPLVAGCGSGWAFSSLPIQTIPSFYDNSTTQTLSDSPTWSIHHCSLVRKSYPDIPGNLSNGKDNMALTVLLWETGSVIGGV